MIFVDSPTLEADMAERLAAIREDYRTGKLTPAQLFDEEEFDGVDLDIALRRRANAEIYAVYNGRCVEQLEGLVERVAYVGMYASYADLTAKAANVPTIAALDCVSYVFSEENVSAENEDWARPLFREDPARFADTNAEGSPPKTQDASSEPSSGWIRCKGKYTLDIIITIRLLNNFKREAGVLRLLHHLFSFSRSHFSF